MCTLHPSIPTRPEAFRLRSGASMACVLVFWTCLQLTTFGEEVNPGFYPGANIT